MSAVLWHRGSRRCPWVRAVPVLALHSAEQAQASFQHGLSKQGELLQQVLGKQFRAGGSPWQPSRGLLEALDQVCCVRRSGCHFFEGFYGNLKTQQHKLCYISLKPRGRCQSWKVCIWILSRRGTEGFAWGWGSALFLQYARKSGQSLPKSDLSVHVDFQGRSGGKHQFSQLRETPVPPLPSPAGRMGGIMPSSHSSSAGAQHWVCCSEPSCGWQVAGLGWVATYSPILSKITPRDYLFCLDFYILLFRVGNVLPSQPFMGQEVCFLLVLAARQVGRGFRSLYGLKLCCANVAENAWCLIKTEGVGSSHCRFLNEKSKQILVKLARWQRFKYKSFF